MKLLTKNEYKKIEKLLMHAFNNPEIKTYEFDKAIGEIQSFFKVPLYEDFLYQFYFNRNKYKNRYPDNRSMLRYLGSKLYVQESTLYMMRKEILYKSAMIFYKYNII